MKTLILAALMMCSLNSCGQKPKTQAKMEEKITDQKNLATATFGTGCFWCTEAVYEEMAGVVSAVSGYSGGFVANPTYEQVCAKNTGHIECVEIKYDPAKVSYAELLEVFFRIHDPTSKDRQGNDVGPQYRSVIFYHDDAQKDLSEKAIKELNASGAFSAPIVTQVSKLEKFWVAEDYHQGYFANNPGQGYCAYVVAPKVEKFKKVFKEKLKSQH
jgi:peptide-methionine (S)-S-oxide reductase